MSTWEASKAFYSMQYAFAVVHKLSVLITVRDAARFRAAQLLKSQLSVRRMLQHTAAGSDPRPQLLI